MELCECGNPKQDAALACERCLALDGANDDEQELIASLRALGASCDVSELAQAVCVSERSAYRLLKPLVERGRVTKRNTREGGRYSRTLYELRAPA